ncbi:UNVERIFIED_CONTAM: hypothetical protein FKN15_058084 [Acipenser sinensis]
MDPATAPELMVTPCSSSRLAPELMETPCSSSRVDGDPRHSSSADGDPLSSKDDGDLCHSSRLASAAPASALEQLHTAAPAAISHQNF